MYLCQLKKNQRIRWRSLLVWCVCFGFFVGLYSLPSVSWAYQVLATAKQAGNKVARWYTLPVKVDIHQDGAPDVKDGSDVKAIQKALQAWTVPSCNNLQITPGTTTTTSFAGRKIDPTDIPGEFMRDGKSVIRFETKKWDWSKLELARNATYFDPIKGNIKEADLLFNAIDFKWSTNQSTGTIDIETVALARIGIMLGLWYSDVAGSLLHPGTDLRSINRSLHSDDINGSCFLYPTSGWKNPPPPEPGTTQPGPEPPPATGPEPDPGVDSGPTNPPTETPATESNGPGTGDGGCQCQSTRMPSWSFVLLLLVCGGLLLRQRLQRR